MRIFIGYALSLSLFVLSACDRREAPENRPTPDPATAPNAATPSEPVTSSPAADAGTNTPTADDSLALGLLGALNEHEIAAAKQAEGKKVSAPVLEYAKMMETQHSENQKNTLALGSLADTDEVQAKKAKGEQELSELDKKTGKQYETAYIDAMVKGHTDALSLIDTRLLALASSEPVKRHMKDTREHVAMHLEAARKLQGAKNAD